MARGICPLRDHKVDQCACLHSGSVWPFSCKGKSRTKVLQAAASKLWQACCWWGFVGCHLQCRL